MERLKENNGLILRIGYPVTAVLICLLAVFPEQYYLINIAVVLLLTYFYLIHGQLKVKPQAIFVGLFMLAEVILSKDMARVSIFVFYLFLSTGGLYQEAVAKSSVRVGIAFLCLVVGAYVLFGFHQEYDKLSWDFVRHDFFTERALGFTNPNRCMLHLFFLSCMVLLRAKKVWQYLTVLGINWIFYEFTQSRTFFYVIVFIAASLLLLKLLRRENTRGLLGKWIPAVFLVMAALSVVLPLYFSDTFLNDLFSRRLVHNKAFLATGITVLGNSTLELVSFDSAYLHMLLTKGVLFFAVYALLLMARCWRARITNKQAVVLCAVFLTGFMEVIFLEYQMMYLMGYLLHATTGEEPQDDE